MTKFAILLLAASAASVPAAAAAQPAGAVQARHMPAPGHSWGDPRNRAERPDGAQWEGRQRARRFAHVPRIERGGAVPQFWWGPQFHVQNWQMYGFAQPMPGHRWVRYYDDALMIDRRGVVRDGRYGLDWDRYGDRWSYDSRGIPAYVGDGDFEPGPEDYAWVDQHRQRGYANRGHQRGGYPAGACGQPQHQPGYPGGGCGGYAYPAPQTYGHGAGYGYGYGYGAGYGTVTVVETIVTGGTATIVEEVIEEEMVATRARRAYRPVGRAAPVRRPIRGERG